jgi:hypothetical protein
MQHVKNKNLETNNKIDTKTRNRFLVVIALALTLPVTLIILVSMTNAGGRSAANRPEGPCDIYAAAGFPCVAAHSSTRALLKTYNGPLYQLSRQSDGKTLDIGVVKATPGDPGGYADAAAQDAFCANTMCWITILYDQSGNGNHLYQAPPGTFRGPAKGGFNTLPIADMAPITIMGHKAYGVYIIPGMGLRNNNASGLPINDDPQGIYMVFDGKHFDSGCCFNYGNTSTNSRAVGRGTMETVYFGTATAWGSGTGPGPWIMSDMEAGLFSGYNAKQNTGNPTIDSWQFVTGVVNGGGGNKWEIWGGNAQEGSLAVFYKGVRPGSNENNFYYPMHRKGAVQLGNGGDNGNGSAGTFYEGVITKGYPDEEVINAVQSNIVAARYDVERIRASRLITFTPGTSQEITHTFTNTTGNPVTDVTLSIVLPKGWDVRVSGSGGATKTFPGPVEPGASVSVKFTVTSGSQTGADYVVCKADWKNPKTRQKSSETSSQRVRNAFPVRINEVRLNTGFSPNDQFIELYNSGNTEVDLSGWTLINTQAGWAPVKLAVIPSGTRLQPGGFYLLGLSVSGLAVPANSGESIIYVSNADGFKSGQQIDIDGEKRTIVKVGTAASPMTTVFVPVSTGPWLNIPAGSSSIPVISTAGFEAGQKIAIDMGGNYEIATVTAVGKASTLTNLAFEAREGDTVIKVTANSNMTPGDELTIGTGSRKELVTVKRLITIAAAPVRGGFGQPSQGAAGPGEVELATALRFSHMADEDVSTPGTGISFSPATRFAHRSGDAVQASGSGIILDRALEKNHEPGAPVNNPLVTSSGFQGSVEPDQLYGMPLSASSGSIALIDGSGKLVVDAMVYGSQQSNSSANGTVPSPELATLEGDQSQGGCIVVVPGTGFSGSGMALQPASFVNRSLGRFPDGYDNDNNCYDFKLQTTNTLLCIARAGSDNIKTDGTAEFSIGQEIIIGTGGNKETAVIKTIGTPGSTTISTATRAGVITIPVTGSEGFQAGQTVTIDEGENHETAIIASITAGRRRFGSRAAVSSDSVTFTMPLNKVHNAGVQVSGSGITLAGPLSMEHEKGTQVAGSLPTPGEPNRYFRKQNEL